MQKLKGMTAVFLFFIMLIGIFIVPVSAQDMFLGDIDQNGRVTTADARAVLRHAVRLDTLEEIALSLADVNQDGFITTADARLALRVAVQLDGAQPAPEQDAEQQGDIEQITEDNKTLTIGDFLPETVSNAQEAIVSLASQGETLGYVNALSELTEIYTKELQGLINYRLQQNYEGVPVYGKAAVLMTDTSGNPLFLSDNVMDVNADRIVNAIILTADEAQQAMASYFEVATNAIDCEQDVQMPICLYLQEEDMSWRYCYVYNVLVLDENGGAYEVLTDAQTGEVLFSTATTVEEISTTLNIGDYTFNVTEEDGEYSLWDQERNIYIYNYNGNDSSVNNNNRTLCANNGGDFAEAEVELMYNSSAAYDFFYDQYQDDASGVLYACYNDGFDGGNNALGGYIFENGQRIGYVSMGTNTGTQEVDVIGHEYTHFVVNNMTYLSDSGRYAIERSAIKEGLSDLFGCIIDAYAAAKEEDENPDISQLEPTWIMRAENIGVYRNLKDPSQSNNAERVNSYTQSSTDEYYLSTLLSHSAYLMWNGINDDEDAKLNTEELSLLWYVATSALPSDTTFEYLRLTVELCAAVMRARGMLTDKQLACVVDAFDAVNIDALFDAEEYVQKLKPYIPYSAGEFNGHYYYVYSLDDVTTWDGAQAFCEEQGGYLATLTTQEENDYVHDYMKEQGYNSAYFGFTDAEEEGTWQWVTGEEVSFTNWHGREPNGENSNEDYAMFYYKFSDKKWNDGDFGRRTVNSGRAFICEWGSVDSTVSDAEDDDLLMRAYRPVLESYSSQNEGSEYTLYDIDKNGLAELIIEPADRWNEYDVYTIAENEAVFAGSLYGYARGSIPALYEHSENGIVVYGGGEGSYHMEYITCSPLIDNSIEENIEFLYTTEEAYSYADLQEILSDYTPIDNFLPVTDETLLHIS